MGIRNGHSIVWLLQAQYTSLPLMGIRNGDNPVLEEILQRLITPHGD